MLDLFSTGYTRQTRMIKLPVMQHAVKRYTLELERLHQYYLERKFLISNRQLLNRILKSLNISYNQNVFDFVEAVTWAVRDYESMFQLTSSSNAAYSQTDHHFFNKRVNEVVISTHESFDVVWAVKNWKSLNPVRLLDHPTSDISYTPLLGNYDTCRDFGVAYIILDIPKLALQHYMWVKQQSKLKLENPRTTHDFIVQYPAFNMMKSHIDITVFNRMYNNLIAKDNCPFNRRIPVAVNDHMREVDMAINTYLEYLKRTPLDFETIIDNMPTICAGSFRTTIALPNIARTHQVEWALVASRLKLIHFLLLIDDFHSTKSFINRGVLNKINITIKTAENAKFMKYGLLSDTDNRLREVKTLLQKRLG